MINTVSKPRLQSLLLVRLYELLLLSGLYVSRAGNRQRGFAGLVDKRGRGFSDKDYLNVLRGKDLRRRDGPSILESGNKKTKILWQETRAWQGEKKAADLAGVGIRQDGKVAEDLRWETRADIQQENKTVGDPKRETKVGIGVGIRAVIGMVTEQGNKTGEDSRRGKKGDPTRAQSFASRFFFLAAGLFFFFTTSS